MEAARQVAQHVAAAHGQHPWTGVRFSSVWGSRDALDVVRAHPDLVAEIGAETSIDRGVFRHPLRFRRLRLDVTVGDVPRFGEGRAAAAG